MIIDLILDRSDGEKYSARRFYGDCMEYGQVGRWITRAMDYGTEAAVKQALIKYLEDQGYSLDIAVYINSVDWLKED